MRPVVLIEAGPGYGKTSLLAGNVSRSGRRVFWYTFDSCDCGPHGLQTMARTLATSIAFGRPNTVTTPAEAPPALDAEAIPASAVESGAHPETPTTPTLLSTILHHIRSAPEGWNLVFDDLHCAGAACEQIAGFLATLAAYLPPGNTVFITSRETIPIRGSKLGAAGQIAAITPRDLQFTKEETVALFHHHLPERPQPSPSDLEWIATKTEGWAAGLGICLRCIEAAPGALRVRETAEPYGATQDPAPDDVHAPDAGWFSYFAEHVLESLDASLARFLVRASILPHLTPELCNEVLRIEDSAALLDGLHRRNLFTTCISRGGAGGGSRQTTSTAARRRLSPGKLYRFHSLFQEFLRKQLETTVPGAEIQSLRRRAARCLLRSGAWAEAAVLLSEAGDTAATLRILEKHGISLLISGHSAILLRVFDSLRAADYESRPTALFVLGRIHQTQGNLNEAERLFQRALEVEAAESAGGARPRNTRGTLASHAPTALHLELTSLLTMMQIHRGRFAEGARLCREALATPAFRSPPFKSPTSHARTRIPRGKHLRAWGRLTLLLGGCEAELGNLTEADEHFRLAADAFTRAGDRAAEIQAVYFQAICIHRTHGDLKAATKGVQRTLDFFQRAGDAAMVCQCRSVLASLLIENADEPHARRIGEEVLRQAESFELPAVVGSAHITLGRCAMQRARAAEAIDSHQDRTEAASHFTAALEIGDLIHEPDLRIHSHLDLGWIALGGGTIEAARSHATAARDRALKSGSRLGEADACVLLGACDNIGAPARSPTTELTLNQTWARAESIFRSLDAGWRLHRLLLLRLHAGDVPGAAVATALTELLNGVVRMAHESLLLTEDPAAGASALVLALQHGIAPQTAADLLLRMGEDAVPALRNELERNDPQTQMECARLLSRIGGNAALAALTAVKNPTRPFERLALRTWKRSAAPPVEPLRIKALGPLHVQIGDRDLGPGTWKSERVQRLLVFLLIHDGWVRREEIIDALWPNVSPSRGRQNLRQTMYELRETLQPDQPARQPSRYVTTEDQNVRLDRGEESFYDVEQFEDRLDEASTPDTGAQRTPKQKDLAIRNLQTALSLYRGEFAEGLVAGDYLEEERRRLLDRWVHGATALLEMLAAGARWEEIVPLARSGILRHSLHDKFHYHLIQALLRSGNRTEAVRAYREHEEICHRELRVLPSRQVKALLDAA